MQAAAFVGSLRKEEGFEIAGAPWGRRDISSAARWPHTWPHMAARGRTWPPLRRRRACHCPVTAPGHTARERAPSAHPYRHRGALLRRAAHRLQHVDVSVVRGPRHLRAVGAAIRPD
eukprot:6361626-Prymnesium_polylepis.1